MTCKCGNPNCEIDTKLAKAIKSAMSEHLNEDSNHNTAITLNIAFISVIDAARQAGHNPDLLYEQAVLHYQFRKGLISKDDLRSGLLDMAKQNLSPEDFKKLEVEVDKIVNGVKNAPNSEESEQSVEKEISEMVDNVIPINMYAKNKKPVLN